jgi:hypothetical protein
MRKQVESSTLSEGVGPGMTAPTPPTEPTPPTDPFPGTAPPLNEIAIAAAASAYLTDVVTRWLDVIRPAVFPAPGVIDPFGVLSGTAAWLRGIRQWMTTQLGPRLLQPLLNLFGPRGRVFFDQGPFVNNYARQVENLLVGVPDQVFRIIRDIVQQAADTGTPVPQTAELIRTELLNANAPMWTNRAETIARTELRRAQMGGLHNAYSTYAQERDIELIKQWLDSDDTRVRPAHVDTDGQRRRIDQPFAVGVDGGPKFPAMYPLDPSLPAELSINCRCDMLIEEAGERMTSKANRGFKGGDDPLERARVVFR